MGDVTMSRKEERIIKWLAQYKNRSMKVYVWILFLCTLLIWVKHWNKFTQSWGFFIENAAIWLGFNLVVYFSIKYDPVLYDLIQRLSKNKKIPE